MFSQIWRYYKCESKPVIKKINLVILCHWLASQDPFSIKWRQVFKTYLNNNLKKTKFKSAIKLKSESKCDPKDFIIFYPKIFVIFSEGKGILQQNISFLFLFFCILEKFWTQKKKKKTLATTKGQTRILGWHKGIIQLLTSQNAFGRGFSSKNQP
jgi:hypothetical protein